MTTTKLPIPGTPFMGHGSFSALVSARPDLFDDFDCRPSSESRLSDDYSDSLIPDYLRTPEFMARRRARLERERRAKVASR